MKSALNIGCGSKLQTSTEEMSWINLDLTSSPGVVGRDIRRGMPFNDEMFHYVLCDNVLEHFVSEDAIFLINEIGRVLKYGGEATIIVPHKDSQGAVQDPTHKCVMPDTEILTADGFKLITDCRIGEKVLSLEIGSAKTQWAKITEVIDEDFDGEMIEFKGQRIDLSVTPNHRLCVNDIFRSLKRPAYEDLKMLEAELVRPRIHRAPATIPFWEGKTQERWDLPMPNLPQRRGKPWKPRSYNLLDFCRFLGWHLAEGSAYVSREGYMHVVTIAQSEHVEHRRKIESAVSALGYRFRWAGWNLTFQHRELCLWLKKFGHSRDKYIPNEFKLLAKPYLEALLEGLIEGDGFYRKSGFSFSSSSKRLASDVQEISIKCGYRASLWADHRKAGQGFAKVDHIMYTVSGSKGRGIHYPQPKKVSYKGRVVCVSLDRNHTFLARRNGKCIWTGNSLWVPRSCLYWNQVDTPYGGKAVGITANLVRRAEPVVYGDMGSEAFIRFEVTRIP